MGRYTRKDGTVVITRTVYDKAMNKRGISKIVHVIPAHPEFQSKAFARALGAIFGEDLRHIIGIIGASRNSRSDSQSERDPPA